MTILRRIGALWCAALRAAVAADCQKLKVAARTLPAAAGEDPRNSQAGRW